MRITHIPKEVVKDEEAEVDLSLMYPCIEKYKNVREI